VHRRVVLLALVACEPPAPAPEPLPPRWAYAPPPLALPAGELRGRIGRSQAPQQPLAAGITGSVRAPLRDATAWQVPGPGPARAVVMGQEGARLAVELIELDAGKLVWRDDATCAGPVVGVTADAIVCSDGVATRALGVDGKPRWRVASPFVAMTDARVVVAEGGRAVVVDAGDGHELARVALPAPLALDDVVASCGTELFVFPRDGKLVRVADGKLAWSVALDGDLGGIDACRGESVLALGDRTLVAIDRETGRVTGRVPEVRGYWRGRADDERIEVSTSAGVTSYPRDLAGAPFALPLPPLGDLLAERGEQRLVRATPLAAVVIDRAGVRAYVAFGWPTGALGDAAAVGAGETVRRIGLPARPRRTLRVPPLAPGVEVPAELRDLPAPRSLDARAAIAKPDTGMRGVVGVAVDPQEPATLYALAVDKPDATTLARCDLAAAGGGWRWQRSDACGTGAPRGVAVAREVVVCAATEAGAATVRATSRDGVARWEWQGDNVDAIAAAGDSVLVHDADRAYVIDADTGRVTGRLASDDGGPVRATLVAAERATWLVAFEHGRLVARLPRAGLVAAWSLAVDGLVRRIVPSNDGVLVELDDGDAYRVDLDGIAAPLPGLGVVWEATAGLVTGETSGGPVFAPPAPPPAAGVRVPARFTFRGRPVRRPLPDDLLEPPVLWKPIPTPPPTGAAWQLTLYELAGAVRARNDYALVEPIQPARARGPAGSPLVVAFGPQLRNLLVLDPRTGNPLQQVSLADDVVPFATVVDGSPRAGVVLAAPLRIVMF